MFAKLIKYNLKAIIKAILPFLLFLFFSVALFSITGYEIHYVADAESNYAEITNASDFQKIIHSFANFLITCSIILLLAAAVKATWQRFKTNFYSDQAYLTHTLPLSRSTLWNAYFCSTLLTFAIVVGALVINCFIFALTRDGQQFLESLGLISGCSHCYGDYYYIEPRSIDFYLSFILVLFTELTVLSSCGVFGIVLSNRLHKNHPIIYGAILYIFSSLLMIGLLFLVSNFDSSVLEIFGDTPMTGTPGYQPDLSFMSRALFYIGGIYTCYCIALHFANRKLLQQGVNLE